MNTTDLTPLPDSPSIEQYRKQAKDLLKAYRSGDADIGSRFEKFHPHPGRLLDPVGQSSGPALADAQLLIAREHGFDSWPKFTRHIRDLARDDSAAATFELAADAVVAGDVPTLRRLLDSEQALARARSPRLHRATLLHYVGANGVENYRQKSPRNAVEIAKMLLDAGAEVDAPADTYGTGTALGLVATSIHPVVTGVQIPLMEKLIEAGASVDGLPGGWNPLVSALHNGRPAAAEYLASRGARLDLEGASGVGNLERVRSFFNRGGSLRPNATQEQMKDGYTWACEYDHTDVVAYLLQRGIAVDLRVRHHGGTGLHWAALGGHLETVKLLLESQASVNVRDESFNGTPLGWALHGWVFPAPEASNSHYLEVVALLVRVGAEVDPTWFETGDRKAINDKVRADPRMQAALRGES